MAEKITGYSLLSLGLLLITVTTANVFSVFSNKARPVTVFHLPPVAIDLTRVIQNSLPPEINRQTASASELKTELISSKILNDTANIVAHLLLAGFMVSVGYKIASLGTLLIRPIQVKLKT